MAALYCSVLIVCVLAFSGYITEGKELKVASILTPPYLYKNNDEVFTGYIPDLLDKMGYNYTIVEAKVYGRKVNDKWTGMMQNVVDGDVDAAGLLTMSKYRLDDVEFSHPVMSVGPVIVMKKPPLDKPSIRKDLLKLLQPFEVSVWLVSMLALLVTGTVLYLISHFNPYEWRRMAKDREATLREAESFTCLNSFWYILSTLFLQGYVRSPRSIGGRVVVAGWWVYVIFFIFSYLACLTNFLAVGPEPFAVQGYFKVRSMKNLAANDEIRVGVVNGGSTEHYFQTSSMEAEQRIYDRIISSRSQIPKDLNSSSDLIEYLRERPFADFSVILESDLAKFNTYQLPCDLYMINEGSISQHLGFAFQKTSQQLRREFDLKLAELRGTGVFQVLESKWFKQRCSSAVYTPNRDGEVTLKTFYPLDLGTASGAILILIAGIIIGGLITLIEVCIFKWAETHYDDDESVGADRPNQISNDVGADDRLLPNSGTKKGGATSV